MTTKKVNLAYITDDSTRKATFMNRKAGFIKKMKEITTLCDIDTCAIIYSPYDREPVVLSSSSGIQRVLNRFKAMPERKQSNKVLNQESFLQQRIDKANKKLNKLQKENREKEIAQLMFQCLTGGDSVLRDLNILDLNDLSWVIDQNLKEIDKRIERLGGRPMQDEYNPQLPQPNLAAQKVAAEGMLGSGGDGENAALVAASAADSPMGLEATDMNNVPREQQEADQWFMHMINNCPEEENMELVEEVMLPIGETGQEANGNGFFP